LKPDLGSVILWLLGTLLGSQVVYRQPKPVKQNEHKCDLTNI